MYAIIADGGNQYRVEQGQRLEVQRRDLPEGTTTVAFDRVLLVGDVEGGPKIGQPVVAGAKVTATVVGEFKDEKIVIQKFRRRKNYARKQGHRQRFLRLTVESIEH
ncbi:MAG: 50S ribosomal protein L21 [Planctomycetes bacterium]|nr:50S ribosomal protein L21 [Planctomycetota bacterium]